MSTGSSVGASRRVQELLLRRYIAPAKHQRQDTVRVVAGELVRELGLWARVPQVCSAMRSRRFLRQHGLAIAAFQGPPSGQSTTVSVTYLLLDSGDEEDPLLPLYGRLREAYAAEGGGEQAHRRERRSFERKHRP